MSSKRKKNVIHLITRISVIGITVTTAALIILIAAFNGIESMVERLYSSFDANLTIQPATGKSFDEKTIDIGKIRQTQGVALVSKAIEEIVILKHEKKWVNARLFCVEKDFLELAQVSGHMVDGNAVIEAHGDRFGLIGATLLDKLQGFIPEHGYESIVVYFPKRNAKVSGLSNPFRTELLKISGRINYNKEVNEEALLIPLEMGQEMLDYEGKISAVYVNCKHKEELYDVKERLEQVLGPHFKVKTHFEKNALIYQTSKTEKMIVICILVFIFILAIFNLIASLTMLYIEKKDNILTLKSMGASPGFIFRIFFFEGLLISFKGIFFGLVLGLIIAFCQYYFKILILPNSGGQAFPMWITLDDSLLVFGIVSIISILASYLTISFLIKNQLQHEQ